MVRILVLTKNVLVEEKIIKKLQHLSYEVFCSTSILNEIQMNGRVSDLVNHFPIIVIGKTISSYEMELMLPKLKGRGQSILREVDHHLSEEEQQALKQHGLNGAIQNSNSVELLREQLAEIATQYQARLIEPVVEPVEPVAIVECSDEVVEEVAKSEASEEVKKSKKVKEDKALSAITLLNLSSLELELLEKLRSRPGEVISRTELCQSLWGDVSKSRLAQLSSLVKSIKLKLEILDIDQEEIQTIWGKGYRVHRDTSSQSK